MGCCSQGHRGAAAVAAATAIAIYEPKKRGPQIKRADVVRSYELVGWLLYPLLFQRKKRKMAMPDRTTRKGASERASEKLMPP